MSISKST
ncbi:unnamed protein product, partial [Rotaria sordida]